MEPPDDLKNEAKNLVTNIPIAKNLLATATMTKNREATAPMANNLVAAAPLAKNLVATAPMANNLVAAAPLAKNLVATAPMANNLVATAPMTNNLVATAPMANNLVATATMANNLVANIPMAKSQVADKRVANPGGRVWLYFDQSNWTQCSVKLTELFPNNGSDEETNVHTHGAAQPQEVGQLCTYFDQSNWTQCSVELTELFPNNGSDDETSVLTLQAGQAEERDLRSTQPNVTRSASRNSYIARTTVINHDRLSRDDSPARRKSAKKVVKKLASKEQSSKSTSLVQNSSKSAATSRDGSTESRRSARSREASEDRRPCVGEASEQTAAHASPVRKKVSSKPSSASPQRLSANIRRKGASESMTSSSTNTEHKSVTGTVQTIIVYPKHPITAVRKPLKSTCEQQKQRPKKRLATAPSVINFSKAKGGDAVSDAHYSKFNAPENSNLRKSERSRQSVSPSKVSSGDNLSDTKRDKADSGNRCIRRTIQISDSAKQEKLVKSKADEIVETDMPDAKTRVTRNRVGTSGSVPSKELQRLETSVIVGQPCEKDQGRVGQAKDLRASKQPASGQKAEKVKSLVPCSPVRKPVKRKMESKGPRVIPVKAKAQQTCSKNIFASGQSATDVPKASSESAVLLDYELRTKRGLSRELSNLTFCNPGRATAGSLIPADKLTDIRTKRLHSSVRYSAPKSVKRLTIGKQQVVRKEETFSSLSHLRIWKEKQSAVKRKKAVLVAQEEQPSEKKRKLDLVPEASTGKKSTSTLATTVEQKPNTVLLKSSSQTTSMVSTQRENILSKFVQHGPQKETGKRKRGRPPKSKRTCTSNSNSDNIPNKDIFKESEDVSYEEVDLQSSITNILGTSQEVDDPSHTLNTSSTIQRTCVEDSESPAAVTSKDVQNPVPDTRQSKHTISMQNVTKKKRKKYKRYKGSLDSSFKSKKKSAKHLARHKSPQKKTLKRVSFNDPVSSPEHSFHNLPIVKKQPQNNNESLKSGESFAEDSVHEEHSYAKNSHTEFLKYKDSLNEDNVGMKTCLTGKARDFTKITYQSKSKGKQEPYTEQKIQTALTTGDVLHHVSVQKQLQSTVVTNKTTQSTNNNSRLYDDSGFSVKPLKQLRLKPGVQPLLKHDPKAEQISSISMSNIVERNWTENDHQESTQINQQETTSLVKQCGTPTVSASPPSGTIRYQSLTFSAGSTVEDTNSYTQGPQESGELVSSPTAEETGSDILPVTKPVEHEPTHTNDSCKEMVVGKTEPLEKTEDESSNSSVLSEGTSNKVIESTTESDRNIEESPLAEEPQDISMYSETEVSPSDNANCERAWVTVTRPTTLDSETNVMIDAKPPALEEKMQKQPIEATDSPLTETLPDLDRRKELCKSTSPLTVCVEGWEDTDAPPKLTPVKPTVSQSSFPEDEESCTDLISPPILSASDSCLAPILNKPLCTEKPQAEADSEETPLVISPEVKGHEPADSTQEMPVTEPPAENSEDLSGDSQIHVHQEADTAPGCERSHLETLNVIGEAETSCVESGTVPSEEEIIPVETDTFPLQSKTVSVELDTIPLETGTISAEEDTISVEALKVPAEAHTIPIETKTIPLEESIPGETEETTPWEAQETIPLEAETVLVDAGIPGDVGKTHVEANTIPVEVGTFPAEAGTTLVEAHTDSVEAQTVPVEAQTTPVEIQTTPVDTDAILLEPKTAVEGGIIPEEADAVPVEAETIPVEAKIVSVQAQTVPVEAQTIPVEAETAPVEAETAPVDTDAAPLDTEAILLDPKTVPVKGDLIPEEADAIPVEVDAIPVGAETVRLDAETVRLEAESVRLDAETVPIDAETVPLDADAVHEETETIPLATENIPMEPATMCLEAGTTPVESGAIIVQAISIPLEDAIPESSTDTQEGDVLLQVDTTVLQKPSVPFKRPRGRPKKIKGKKYKASKSDTAPVQKLKPKSSNEQASTSGPPVKPSMTITRTFALRPQISRSPLENIALRFGGEEAYLSFKKKGRTSTGSPLHVSDKANKGFTEVTSDCTQGESSEICALMAKCKPCSVVLTDFVKQLNLESIDSSLGSDSDEYESTVTEDLEREYGQQSNQMVNVDEGFRIPSARCEVKQVKKKELSPSLSLCKEDSDQDTLATEILEMFANYKCKYCNYCSESSQLMDEHIYIHKDFFVCYPISCLNCPRRFPDQRSFGDHHLEEHLLQQPKYEVIRSIDEKDHYQIVLRDGSTIDLKMADLVGGNSNNVGDLNICGPSKTDVQQSPEMSMKEQQKSEDDGPFSEEGDVDIPFNNSSVDPEDTETYQSEHDPEVEKVLQSILDEIERDSEADLKEILERIEQSSVPVAPLEKNTGETQQEVGGLPELCGDQENKLDEGKEVQCSSKLSETPASPVSILLTKDAVTDSEDELNVPTDGQTEGDTSEEESTALKSNKDTLVNTSVDVEKEASEVDVTQVARAKVDPVVEKLRKIVRSVPTTMSTSSNTVAHSSSMEGCRPSVLVQTEQDGKKESSVINTSSTSTAPVIISVVVSGNVEVTTPDASRPAQSTSNKFTCTHCMHGSDDHSRMVEHVTQMHPDDMQYTCFICDKAFSSKMSVIHQHIKTNHPGQDEHKMCKALPSFYAVDEVREHDSVRMKTSDNIFEMFGSTSDGSSATSQKHEPLRQHFRKARDVMHFREKAKRQAEADSTTSGTGDEVDNTTAAEPCQVDPSESASALPTTREPSNTTTADIETSVVGAKAVFPDHQSVTQEKTKSSAMKQAEDDSNTVTSSEKTTPEPPPLDGTKFSADAQEDETQEESITNRTSDEEDIASEDTAEQDTSDCDSMLKIVSVVSLSGLENSPVKPDVPKASSEPDSGEITREAAQSAVSALFKKSPKPSTVTGTSCKQCGENLTSMQGLYFHLQNVHKLTCFYSCPLCSQHLRKTEEGVRQHILSVHGLDDPTMQVDIVTDNTIPETKSKDSLPAPTGLQCKHCSSSHSSAGALLKHLESVHGENCLLVCPYCKKGISKDEAEVYNHIKIQHKNYDVCVPLLLVSNRGMPVEKTKQSLTISEKRRQLFASKTIEASKSPGGEGYSRNTAQSDSEENMEKLPGAADSEKAVETASVSHSLQTKEPAAEDYSGEPTDNLSVISSSPSPLTMLKKTTSSILSQAASEAASALRVKDTTVNTFSAFFNVQPTASVAKRNVPIRPKPDGQVVNPVYLVTSPPAQIQPAVPSSLNKQSLVVSDFQQKPRPIVPRGIKHVERRSLKDLSRFGQVGSVPDADQQHISPYRPASAHPDFQISQIPAIQPATAIATTVTRPLLRVPSVIPSTAGKPLQPRPNSTGISNPNQPNTVPFATGSPFSDVSGSSYKSASSPAPKLSPTGETPLDLSRSASRQDIVEPEEDVDPDAFNVFNLCPEKRSEAAGQPLNLSVKVPPVSGQPVFPVGYRPPIHSQYPGAYSSVGRPVTMPGASRSANRPGTPHSFNVPGTPRPMSVPGAPHPTGMSESRPNYIRGALVKHHLMNRYGAAYSPQHPSQMNPRYARPPAGQRSGNSAAGTQMIQRAYPQGHRPVHNVQEQSPPQLNPRMRQPFAGFTQANTPQQGMSSRQAQKYMCPSCDFCTQSSTAMKAHITNVHKARYRCPYCTHLVPLTQRDVAFHIYQQHPGKKLMYFNL